MFCPINVVNALHCFRAFRLAHASSWSGAFWGCRPHIWGHLQLHSKRKFAYRMANIVFFLSFREKMLYRKRNKCLAKYVFEATFYKKHCHPVITCLTMQGERCKALPFCFTLVTFFTLLVSAALTLFLCFGGLILGMGNVFLLCSPGCYCIRFDTSQAHLVFLLLNQLSALATWVRFDPDSSCSISFFLPFFTEREYLLYYSSVHILLFLFRCCCWWTWF